MTTASELLASVEAALPTALNVNLTATTDPWDLFEAYVFAQVVQAAAADGYVVQFARLRAGPQFVFRRGPGSIWSTAFSYALLDHPVAPERLEVHVGVRIEGQSGVAHEADVSVLLESEADDARQQRFAPRTRACVLAFECKYYLARLGLSNLREYLGLTTDLRSGKVRRWLVSNVSHPELPTMLKHHNQDWADDVLPGTHGEHSLRQQVEPVLNRFRR